MSQFVDIQPSTGWKATNSCFMFAKKYIVFWKISFLGVSCFRPIQLVLFGLWLSNYNYFDGAVTVHLCSDEDCWGGDVEMKEGILTVITDRTPTKRQTVYFSKPVTCLDVGILPSMQLHVTISVTLMQTENIHNNVFDAVYGSVYFLFWLLSPLYC